MSGWDGSPHPTPPTQTRWPLLVTTGTTTWFPSFLPSPTRRFMLHPSSWDILTPLTWLVSTWRGVYVQGIAYVWQNICLVSVVVGESYKAARLAAETIIIFFKLPWLLPSMNCSWIFFSMGTHQAGNCYLSSTDNCFPSLTSKVATCLKTLGSDWERKFSFSFFIYKYITIP